MAEQGLSSDPHAPQATVPPVASPVTPSAPPAAVPAGHRATYAAETAPRSRRGVWWSIAIACILLLVLGSCALPMLMLSGGGKRVAGGSAVAVIRIDQVIAGASSGAITPEFALDQIEQAEEDARVKAVVLRIDSPGGTVAASEEISAYVEQCTKPVVASIGDVGASGAYMIASQADEIWAMPGSSVGSIGVISEIPNVAGLLDDVGVEFQTITAGEYKDAGTPFRPLTDKERSLIKGEVDEAYDQFIDIVARGRDMERDRVEKLATGWAWSGAKAKKLGLVDQIGTYRDALDSAAKLGKISGDYDVVTYEDEFDQWLRRAFSVMGSAPDLGAALGAEDALRRPLPR